MPEARINLAHAVVAVATAPKSPGIIRGIDAAVRDVRQERTGAGPAHLRDAHYPGAKALGHGAGYLYPHDHPYGIVAQDYLPEGMSSPGYYQPTGNGHEATISASMQTIRQLTQEDDSCLDPSRDHRG